MCADNYGLESAHYVGSPGLSWDAMLKLTRVELELFTDENMYNFMEMGIRGGISTIIKRYAKANNRYLPDFNPNEAESYLMYLDANNLYGYAMSQLLPKSDFKFMSPGEIENTFVSPTKTLKEILHDLVDGDVGYILDVDMNYPHELHDDQSDYPFAPEHLNINPDMYSPFMKSHYGKQQTKSRKLSPNCYNKKNYIVHINNLSMYLRFGLEVTRINNVISFKQEKWLKPYISLNTAKRAMASSKFEKEFF